MPKWKKAGSLLYAPRTSYKQKLSKYILRLVLIEVYRLMSIYYPTHLSKGIVIFCMNMISYVY